MSQPIPEALCFCCQQYFCSFVFPAVLQFFLVFGALWTTTEHGIWKECLVLLVWDGWQQAQQRSGAVRWEALGRILWAGQCYKTRRKAFTESNASHRSAVACVCFHFQSFVISCLQQCTVSTWLGWAHLALEVLGEKMQEGPGVTLSHLCHPVWWLLWPRTVLTFSTRTSDMVFSSFN